MDSIHYMFLELHFNVSLYLSHLILRLMPDQTHIFTRSFLANTLSYYKVVVCTLRIAMNDIKLIIIENKHLFVSAFHW